MRKQFLFVGEAEKIHAVILEALFAGDTIIPESVRLTSCAVNEAGGQKAKVYLTVTVEHAEEQG